ncbi:hypothetical protein GH714_014949 [Hevea brasiliensis]|uniref:Uncharacterized protein n=1 Tax=Hevea brasiliensis TaxID=3981 RepID=A0A6A6KW40_HEVBR|nr:hypothetical protein GH714_014949 [Hevea brasiliensis]
MQEQNIGLTNVYQNTMHANLDTDVHENELLRNCLNYLYYRVDHLVSQNHVNPSQWSFKFVCKNYDWKYKVRIPNHVTHLLDDLNFDTITLFVKDGVDEVIKYYKLKQKFYIIFSIISTQEVEMLMFDTKGVEIDYGFLPLPKAIQISLDDDDSTHTNPDAEQLPTQPNFVSVMNTADWKYKVENQLGKDDEVEFTLIVVDDNRIEFQTEITRAGQ